MRRRSSFALPWASSGALAILLLASLAAAQPLEPGGRGQSPDAQGGAAVSDGAAAPADADRAPAAAAEFPPLPAAAGNDLAGPDEVAPPTTDGPENEVGAPVAAAYAPPPPPPPPPPERRRSRRRAEGERGFHDYNEFGLTYLGGGYPWGVNEGKGGIRYQGRGSVTLGIQATFGQRQGWGFALGLEHSALFTRSTVGESEVPVQFVESAVLPFGVYIGAGDAALIEVEALLALGGMRFENIGKMEVICAVGGRLGALIALKRVSQFAFFVNPRVDYLAHYTANIETAQFLVPTLNLGFQLR